VGLPAKTGVAGAVLVVIPNLMGFATFSPRLDAFGNSVRGVSFCRQLVQRFTFHMYDSLSGGRSAASAIPVPLSTAASSGISPICVGRCPMGIAMPWPMGRSRSQKLWGWPRPTPIMGQPPEHGELRELALVSQEAAAEAGQLGTQGPFEALLERLRMELPLLDDNGRELILESAFRVACADGEIEPEERDQLRAIANALAINEGVLELEIARFQRQMAR